MNIVIHQPTEHIFDCYRESSILVSTSFFEPFGLVIPDAMSCGLPVVAYNCPYGPSGIIRDGVDGYLIKSGDLNEFVSKVCLLMNSIDLRRKMGAAGHVSSSRFENCRIFTSWKQLMNQLMIK